MPADAGMALGNLANKGLSSLGIKTYPELQQPLPGDTFNQTINKYTTAPTTGPGKAAEFLSTALLSSRLPMPTGVAQPPAGFANSAAASNLTSAQQQALQSGAQLGMKVTPGQQMGSKALQQVEAKLESQPWTSGPFSALKAANQGALDRYRRTGDWRRRSARGCERIRPHQNERLGNVFESVGDPNKTADTSATKGVLDAIDSKYEGLLPNDMAISG